MANLVTIIVPVYNIQDYLPACIESILAQEYEEFELILINDGSEDGSGEVCDSYLAKDSRIKVIHQVNQGVSAARNAGIKNAIGDYLTFVDGDDLIHKRYLSEMYACIIAYPDTDIVACGKQDFSRSFNAEVVLKKEKTQLLTGSQALNSLLYQRIINAPFAKLFKASLLSDDSFPSGIKIGEDLLMNIRAFSGADQIGQISEPLYGYRNRPGSAISSSRLPDRKLLILNLLEIVDGQANSKIPLVALQARIFAEAVYGSLSLRGKISPRETADWNFFKNILVAYRKNIVLNKEARTFLRVFALACYLSPRLPSIIFSCWRKVAYK